ncbi:NAD(P)H-dependent glycerol-3-phosphate dehydrogenase [Nakamurella sp.]|uniref:NAD(P)H-dependent glycerol-3-phosphate dehydrogenase n=1 Tax=Nakamurella sp. TaxID=1869182 RepID=UPI0037834B6B
MARTVLRRQPKVAVIGSGSWGTSVASIVARHSPTTIWGRSAEVVEQINTGHTNERYLPGFELAPGLIATTDLQQAVEPADILIMAVPSHGFRGALDDLAPFLRPWAPVVSLVKGLEQGSRKRMTEIVDEVLPGHPAGVLAGPNIAREVVAGYAAAAVIAMPDPHLAAQLGELFRTTYFRIYSSSDVVGVEIAGALKNVFAIAVGMGDGVGSGDNTRAMVITRSLREMTRLGTAVGGQAETFAGLAGMGDLVVTCTSKHSRNRHVGELIGRGVPLAEILAGMKQVAEGVKTASVVLKVAADVGVDVPIAREVDAVVNHGSTPERAYRGLLNEAPGHEVHGDSW